MGLSPSSSHGNGGSQPGAVRWLGPCKINAFAGQVFGASGGGQSDFNGGTFKLTLAGEQTAAIAWNATPAQIITALEALPSLGADTVAVDTRNTTSSIQGLGLIFKDAIATELVTGQSSLTGPNSPYDFAIEGSTDFAVEMFTPAVGDIIEDFMHVVPTSWDDDPRLSYIDDPTAPDPDSLSPGWATPSGSQGSDLGGLAIGSNTATDFTNFFGTAGDPGVQGQATPGLAIFGEWVKVTTHLYTNLPAVVRNAVPIYSRLFDISSTPTQGEVWIWVKVSTPAPLMD